MIVLYKIFPVLEYRDAIGEDTVGDREDVDVEFCLVRRDAGLFVDAVFLSE